MKFDDLYNKVFLSEQDVNTEVASPDDFDDVDPIPLPEPAPEGQPDPGAAQPTASSLTDYISKCNEFADTLQNPNGGCLQSLVASLDKPLTPFEGISNTKSDVEKAAGILRSLAGRLLSFTIAATKK